MHWVAMVRQLCLMTPHPRPHPHMVKAGMMERGGPLEQLLYAGLAGTIEWDCCSWQLLNEGGRAHEEATSGLHQ